MELLDKTTIIENLKKLGKTEVVEIINAMPVIELDGLTDMQQAAVRNYYKGFEDRDLYFKKLLESNAEKMDFALKYLKDELLKDVDEFVCGMKEMLKGVIGQDFISREK